MFHKKAAALMVSCFLFFAHSAYAINADSAAALNAARLKTNRHGMHVLGVWGLANIAGGTIGYFATGNREWKDFQLMNISWGLVNTTIAGFGLSGVKQEMAQQLNCGDMLQRHESNERLYLINAGLDAVYIGTGLFVWEHSGNVSTHAELWSGFGKSIAMQGLFLLLFDSSMYASHAAKNRKWYKLMQGLCINGNGVGLRYTFE